MDRLAPCGGFCAGAPHDSRLDRAPGVRPDPPNALFDSWGGGTVIGVAIADDHPVVREGLQRIIADSKGMRLVGAVANGCEIVGMCQRVEPEVLLLDISMPGPGFLATLKEVNELLPKPRVLVLSVHAEEQFAIRCLQAGAAGYLTKDRSPEALGEAIRCVAKGERYISQPTAQKLAERLGGGDALAIHERLSPREYEIFLFLGSGRSVSAIARELGLSPKTVSTHRARMLAKTKLSSNAEIIRFVVEHRLAH